MYLDVDRLDAAMCKIAETQQRTCVFSIEIIVNPADSKVSFSNQYATFWVADKGSAIKRDVVALIDEVVSNDGNITFDPPH